MRSPHNLLPIGIGILCSIITPFVSATTLEKQEIQSQLNEAWSTPLVSAFYAETCNQPRIRNNIINKLKSNASEEVLSSPITFGFMLGFSNHLLSLTDSAESTQITCNRFQAANASTSGYMATTLDPKPAAQVVSVLNEQLGLQSHIGESVGQSLTLSIYNLNARYSKPLSQKLLLEACEINSSSVPMPSLLDLVNDAAFTQKPTEIEIRQLTEAWRGYSQGMYWHALSLVQNLNDTNVINDTTEKQQFCNKLANINEGH